jgi:hypothetical protein
MSEEGIRGRDDIMIQGDVGESMRLEEAEGEGLHQHIREAGNHQEGEGGEEEEERMSAPSAAVVIPKKSKKSKSKSRKNKKDTTTIASISKQLEGRTAAIDKIGQMLQSLQKGVKPVERQSELIKQIQYQIKQLEKQVSQVDKESKQWQIGSKKV